MSEATKKPRGVLGALSKRLDALQGEIADLREQNAAMKELVGATLRDGDRGVSAHYPSFNEFMQHAVISFIQSAGHGALGRVSALDNMQSLVDVYCIYLAFCGAPQAMIDDAQKRRDDGSESIERAIASHRSDIAAKFQGDNIITPETVGRRHNPSEQELAMSINDPSTWGPDPEAEAFLGPAD